MPKAKTKAQMAKPQKNKKDVFYEKNILFMGIK